MDVGVAVFAGWYGLAPPALGRAVEERGLESLFYAEHTHIPVASRREDGRPTRDYAETVDPWTRSSRWRWLRRPPAHCGWAPRCAWCRSATRWSPPRWWPALMCSAVGGCCWVSAPGGTDPSL